MTTPSSEIRRRRPWRNDLPDHMICRRVGGIMQISKPGKSVYLNIGIWYDKDQGQIHMTAKDVVGFHTTISPNPASKRGHPNLFEKLAKCLREAGAPAPETDGAEGA